MADYDVIIDAGGVNSIVGRRAGLIERRSGTNMILDVTVNVHLGEEIVNRRFGDCIEYYLSDGIQHKAWPWIFPKREVVTLGTGGYLDDRLISENFSSVNTYMQNFLDLPLVQKKLEGGRIAELPRRFKVPSFILGIVPSSPRQETSRSPRHVMVTLLIDFPDRYVFVWQEHLQLPSGVVRYVASDQGFQPVTDGAVVLDAVFEILVRDLNSRFNDRLVYGRDSDQLGQLAYLCERIASILNSTSLSCSTGISSERSSTSGSISAAVSAPPVR